MMCSANQVTGFYMKYNPGLRVAGTDTANIADVFDTEFDRGWR